ncbi:MAG: polar amino acid transport system ATP-binding protein, partial [bacterium]
MSARPVLEVRGVTKAYGETPVLRGVDLEVHEHRAVALIGASGSGKSTLLRCADLLEDIDDGDVLLDGEVITDPAVDPVAVRRRLGMVFQAFNLFPHLT